MKFRVLIILFIFSNMVSAQNKELRVIKFVRNVFNKESILDAKVNLLTEDSILICSYISNVKINNEQGAVVLGINTPGRYIIHATHPDYEDTFEDFEIKRFYKKEKIRQLKPIYMQRKQPKRNNNINEVQNLDEVVVKATKVKFYTNKDTIVYNADAFNLQEGSMLDDLIRQLPGVTLKRNGQIEVNGKTVSELLLNGKAFFNHDRKLILDNLPSFMVSKVTVYDKRTILQELTADSVGSKIYVMDIGLKRKYQIGWLANTEGGIGSDSRFLGRLFSLCFTPHSQITAFGNVNNLNDDRKPGNNEWSPLQQPTSETTVKTAGIDYQIEKNEGELEVGGSITFTNKSQKYESRTSKETFLTNENTFGRALHRNHSNNTNIHTKHKIIWKRTLAHHIEVSPTFVYHRFNNHSKEASATLFNDKFDALWGKQWMDSLASPMGSSMLKRFAINHLLRNKQGEGWNCEGGINYSQMQMIPHRTDHCLIFEANYHYNNTQSKDYDHYNLNYINKGKNNFLNRYNKIRNEGHNFSMSISDRWSIFSSSSMNIHITPNYSYDLVCRNGSSNYFLLNKLTGWGIDTDHFLGELPSIQELELTLDNNNSNNTYTTNQLHTPQIEFYTEKRVNDSLQHNVTLDLKLNIENSKMRYGNADTDTIFRRSVAYFSPSLRYDLQGFTKNRQYNLSIHYKLNINTPSMLYLVNRYDNSNPLYIIQGAKKLEDEHVHDVSISWRETLTGQKMFNMGAKFSIHRNSLAMGQVYDKSTGIRTMTPININGNWNTSVFSGLSTPLDKNRQFTIQWNNTINFWHKSDILSDSNNPVSKLQNVSSLYFEETLKIDYRPSSKFSIGGVTNLHVQYSTSNRKDFRDVKICDFDYGMVLQCQLPYKWQLATDLTMYSRRGYNEQSINTDELVWNVRLSRAFLKGQIVCMLDGFDILGNLSNVRRSIDALGRTETWYYMTPRYTMLHITYRFNKQPKK